MRNLMLNENSRHMFIFDWLSSLLCLVNLGGSIVGQTHLDFPTNCMPNVFADILLEGITSLRAKYPISGDTLLGLGICMPGLIDSRNGIVLNSVEMNWRNVNLKTLFAAEFGEGVYLERIHLRNRRMLYTADHVIDGIFLMSNSSAEKLNFYLVKISDFACKGSLFTVK